MDPEREKDLWSRHQHRREINWVPYQERRSDGVLRYLDDGGKVTIKMEVAGLGTLVFVVEGKYSALLNQIRWDQTAELRARIQPCEQ